MQYYVSNFFFELVPTNFLLSFHFNLVNKLTTHGSSLVFQEERERETEGKKSNDQIIEMILVCVFSCRQYIGHLLTAERERERENLRD